MVSFPYLGRSNSTKESRPESRLATDREKRQVKSQRSKVKSLPHVDDGTALKMLGGNFGVGTHCSPPALAALLVRILSRRSARALPSSFSWFGDSWRIVSSGNRSSGI